MLRKLAPGLIFGLALSCQAALAINDTGFLIRNGTSSIVSPANGKIVLFDSSDNILKAYYGGAWHSLTTAKNNITNSDPGVGNDTTQGYSPTSLWVNTTTDNVWVCTDNTTGAAVWQEMTDIVHHSELPPYLKAAEVFADWLVSGCNPSVPGSGLTFTMPAGIAYVGGQRVAPGSASKTVSASKDSYYYLHSDGTIVVVAVNNGDPAPTGQPGIPLCKVVSGASNISAITLSAPTAPQFVSPAVGSTAPYVVASTVTGLPNADVLSNGDGIAAIVFGSNLAVVSVDSTVARTTGNQTLGGIKTFTSTPVLSTGAIRSGSNVVTLPTVATVVPGVDTTDTLSNKTLNSPIINTPSFPTPITNAGIGNAAKCQVQTWMVNGGAPLVNATTYHTFMPFLRAGTIKSIGVITKTVASGVETLSVLNGSSTGNNCLSTATFDLTGLGANLLSYPALTLTGGDLHLGATSGVWLTITTGTQTTPFDALSVAVEMEPDDF